MQQKLRAALQRYPRIKRCNLFVNNSNKGTNNNGGVERSTSFLLTLSWPDGEADRNKTAVQRFNSSGPDGAPQSIPQQVVVHSPSPTNSRVASLIVEDGGGDDKKKYRVEVWDAVLGPIVSVLVDDVHGPFLASEGISWHDSEEVFAYVADKKFPTGTDPEAFKYREDFGEQYEGVILPGVILFDIFEKKASAPVPSSKAQMQPIFQPSKASPANIFGLAYTCMEQEVFRLGMIYCAQRPSEIRLASLERVKDDGLKMLSDCVVSLPTYPGGPSARSPRFSRDGLKMAFLSSPPSVTHQGPVQISCVDIRIEALHPSQPRVIVDFNKLDKAVTWPDIYAEGIPFHCFDSKGNIYFTTAHYCRRRVLKVDLSNGHRSWIGENAAEGDGDYVIVKRSRTESGDDGLEAEIRDVTSRSLLGVCPVTDRILIVESSPNTPGIVRFVDGPVVYNIGGHVRHDIATRVLRHKSKDEAGGMYESILIYPLTMASDPEKASSKCFPLIVYPHGGPHSAFSTDYSGELAFICEEMQVGILMVNYRGSTGPDTIDVLQSLPGYVGSRDVKDVIQAMEETLRAFPVFDSNRLGVMGGSHGGFLTGHLIGQYPSTFKCAVMRNPVTDVAAMSTVTDIPDWCYVEAMGLRGFDFAKFSNYPPNPEVYKEMFSKSPMNYVDKMTTPTLISIGDKDRRVPPSQGLTLYRALRIRGVEVSLLRFPKDSHPIDRPTSNEIQWTNAIEFMRGRLHIN